MTSSVSPEKTLFLENLPKDSELPFPHVLKVDASAGSGKTFLLACRFIQFLLSSRIPRSHLRNIMAITFTNEAAREMESRVLGLLKKAAFGDEGILKVLEALLEKSPSDIQSAARNAVDAILLDFDSFQIRTIDSFVHRLVLSAPQELGLSIQEEIEPYSDPFLKEAFDRLLLASARDEETFQVLRKAMGHYLNVQNKGAWWPVPGMFEELVGLFQAEGIFGARFSRKGTRGRTLGLAQRVKERLAHFLGLAQREGLCLKKKAAEAFKKAQEGNLTDSLETAWWKKQDVSALFLKNMGVPPSAILQGEWEALRHIASDFLVARALEGPGAYLELYGLWSGELQGLKSQRRVQFFQDINLLSQKLLRDFALPEVFFRLGDELFHFMIDEFQDTSLLQWRNLLPLIENSLSQGGSLLCVGDAKQMLYRWRGSDPDLFRQVPGEIGALDSESRLHLVLPFNWRSCPAIIEFVVRRFEKDRLHDLLEHAEQDLTREDRQEVARVFAHVSQTPPPENRDMPQGFVDLERLEGTGSAEEIRDKAWAWAVETLKGNILPRWNPGDVMVLVRDNRDVEEVSGTLCHHGIPVFSHRQLDIRQDPVVREILAFFQVLQDPSDRVALSTFLTGRIVSEIWENEGPDGCSPQEWLEKKVMAGDHKRKGGLLQVVRDEIPRVFERCFAGPMAVVGHLAPYDLLCRFIQSMGLHQRFPEHAGALDHLLELFHEAGPYGGIQWGDLDDLVHAPDELFMAKGADPEGAVRVMTIHKAKGLEAPVVLLPLAVLAPKTSSRILRQTRTGLELLDLSGKYYQVSEELSRLKRREKTLSWVDELNVVYVALTRAIEELHLLVPEKVGNRRNHLLKILDDLEWHGSKALFGSHRELARKAEARKGEEAGEKGIPSSKPAILPGGWKRWRWPMHLVRSEREITQMLSVERRGAIRAGERVHRLLAMLCVPLDCQRDVGEVRRFLEEFVSGFREAFQDVDLTRLSFLLSHPVMRPFFWPTAQEDVWLEKELVDRDGSLYRLDRAVVTESSITVAEFKTGTRKRAGDVEQLGIYRRVLSGIYPQKDVHGLLVYIDRGEIIQPGGRTWNF